MSMYASGPSQSHETSERGVEFTTDVYVDDVVNKKNYAVNKRAGLLVVPLSTPNRKMIAPSEKTMKNNSRTVVSMPRIPLGAATYLC